MGTGAIWVDVFYLSLTIVTFLLGSVMWKYKLKVLSYFSNDAYGKIRT